ncbi:HAMP domain-containing histidine kinase [Candidatus Gracilibacteria bacterium]|nr:HAMP domain-containing histidine kinase [Candidatus Gracilibacteria bacterium]
MTLSDFSSQEQQTLLELYSTLLALFAILREHRHATADVLPLLSAFTHEHQWPDLLQRMRELQGSVTGDSTRINQIVHDLKGGSLFALSAYLQFLELTTLSQHDVERMFYLARDQLKLMRGSIEGIDDEGYMRDRQQQLHSTELVVEKWSNSLHYTQRGKAQIVFDAAFKGNISERCLEFAALDRVIYNLINNAIAHCADAVVYVVILPLGDHPEHLRFLIYNRIHEDQRATLITRFPDGPSQLFYGGFTTGGQGLGMRICADVICSAYGLATVEQGLQEGHFGVALHDDFFVTWFHWPIVAD